MIKNLEIAERWFVGKKESHENEQFDEKVEMTIGAIPISHGYPTIEEIPVEIKESGDLFFKAYQFEFNGKPVIITAPDFFNEDVKIEHLCFENEEKAKEFIEEIINDLNDDDYWDDDSERRALRALDYDISDDEDFSEISLNEDRRFNEFLQLWYLRGFEGLGFLVKYNGTEFTF